jgi:RNA polymerase sigma-70 factor (ECF subfamily)
LIRSEIAASDSTVRSLNQRAFRYFLFLQINRPTLNTMSELQASSPPPPLKMNQTADEDEIRIIQLASAGDAAALAELYDRHAPLLHSVLTQKLGSSAESEDIVHDVFLKLHTKGALYNPSLGKPVAWLLTVARNMAVDQLRRRSLHEKYLSKQSGAIGEDTAARSGPHEDELELLRHCVKILPDQHRDTLQLAYFSGLTQQEIAEQLCQPLGSVKAWIRRGLIKLRECVEGGL